MDDRKLRYEIYRTLADTGTAPAPEIIAEWVGGPEAATQALRRLHDAHAIVLDDTGRIRMALPFSAVPTDHRVVAGDRSWWANCAWDSLAIPVALGSDAVIEAAWLDTGERVGLAVEGAALSSTDGFVHFAIPARRWWDDIVDT